MKVSVFSFAVNDKFPIDIAYRRFQKHMKEDFEYILFNDAIDVQMEQNINTIAAYNHIKCVRVPQHIHAIQNPSEGYAASLNWAVQQYAPNNGYEIIALIHTDVFPIRDLTITGILDGNAAASTTEYKIVNGQGIIYFYPALTLVNMKLLRNPQDLDFGLEPGLDCGGKTKYFIQGYPGQVKFLENRQILDHISTERNDPLMEYFRDDLFICGKYKLSAGWVANGFYHYMAGSQWNSYDSGFAEGHRQRMELFLKHFY